MVFPKCFSFFLVLFAMTSGKEESSDTDDDALQQALFLVDVLRSDYAKLLLRQNVDAKTENPSTCPLTTENSTSLVSNIATTTKTPEIETSTYPRSAKSLPASSLLDTTPSSPLTTELPRSEFTTGAGSADELDYPEDYPPYDLPSKRKLNNIKTKKFRNFRRMVPMEYYYYDAPIKRRGHHHLSPSKKRAIRPGKRRILKNRKFRRMAPDDIDLNSISPSSSVPPTIMSTTTPVPTTESEKSTPFNKPITNTQPKSTKTVLNASSSVSDLWKSVAIPQVARELFNELKGGGLTMEPPTKSKAQSKLRLRPGFRNKMKGRSGTTKKQSDIAKEQSDVIKSYTRAGTLRIHNARSTPLSLPLSENNAFCFFSPKSPLCRTLI